MKISLFTFSFLVSTLAQAHSYSCQETRRTYLDTTSSFSSDCALSTSLHLTIGERYYPKLRGGYYHVQYWEGAYTRQVQTVSRYQVTTVDYCAGTLVEAHQETQASTSSVDYSVENPNLDREIDRSYLLSPMESEEASLALAYQLQRCQTATK